ncbi:MAG: oligosaccharide flippase family protein, partial [Planctomycetota bacterium]
TLLAMSLRLLEMSTDCAVDRFLIQSRTGNNARLQSNAQGFLVARGVVCGCLFSIAAIPVSWMLGEPSAAYVLACLGMVPVIKGFVHLDHKRSQRDLSFHAAALLEVAAGLAALLMCVPAYAAFPDYRAAVLVISAQAITLAVVSQFVAKRRYCIRFDRPLVRKMLGFGLPFAANGLLMFAILQGDRLIVAFSCSAETLGVFSVAAQFCLIPVLIISRVCNSYYLPLLSRHQRDLNAFRRHLVAGMTILGAVSAVFAIAFCGLGNWALETIYGSAFAAPASLIGWLAVIQVLRLLRAMPSVAAVALGNTRQPLVVNIVRSIALVGAAAAGFSGCELSTIVASGCVGELVAFCLAIALIHRDFAIPLGVWTPAGVTAFGGVIFGWIFAHHQDLTTNSQLLLACLATLLVASQWKSYAVVYDTVSRRLDGVHQGIRI